MSTKIRAGEPAAEEAFVRFFERRIRAFATIHLRDAAWADEVVQETLWAAIRAVRENRVDRPGQLPAFVWGAARNQVNDRIRSKARERTDQLADGMDFPRKAVEHDEFERRRAARQAIDMLEPPERAVLLLGLVDDLRAEEIAERLGLTPETVRQRKSRALKKLAAILGRPSQAGRPELL